jgi:23S rRNA (adenine1618-N6)-methyltransferase
LQSFARLETIANDSLPFPTSYIIHLPSTIPPAAAKQTIQTHLSSLDLVWHWTDATSSGVGEASQNVWSRAKENTDTDMSAANEPRKIELAFRIRVIDLAYEVELQWLRGRDQVLWESLCGLVHRWFRKEG